MSTATYTDGAALLAAICAAPEEDTPRLVYADWLDENGDPARAEFIRVQVELTKGHDFKCWSKPHAPYSAVVCRLGCGLCDLRRRETALLTANEAAWRRGPVCENCNGFGFTKESCGGPGSEQVRCPDCHGARNLGGLTRHDTGDGRWRHPVTFARGFPDEVRCELGEVVEQVEKRFQTYPRDEWEPAEYDTSLEWGVTDWARRVVRYHPVTRFRVTDREPDNEVWWSHKSGTFDSGIPWQLPWLVFDALRGGEKHSPSEKHAERGSDHHNCIYPTPEAAHDALAVAIALLARKANTTLEEART